MYSRQVRIKLIFTLTSIIFSFCVFFWKGKVKHCCPGTKNKPTNNIVSVSHLFQAMVLLTILLWIIVSITSRGEDKNWTVWFVEMFSLWHYNHCAVLLNSCWMKFSFIRKTSLHIFERMESFHNIWLLSPLDQKSIQELVFKAFKNCTRWIYFLYCFASLLYCQTCCLCKLGFDKTLIPYWPPYWPP